MNAGQSFGKISKIGAFRILSATLVELLESHISCIKTTLDGSSELGRSSVQFYNIFYALSCLGACSTKMVEFIHNINAVYA